MVDAKTVGVSAGASALVAGMIMLIFSGGSIQIDPALYPNVDFTKPVWYCNVTKVPNDLQNCNHLSGTNVTCYPFTNSTGGKTCTKSKWQLTALQQIPIQPGAMGYTTKWNCPPNGAECVKI